HGPGAPEPPHDHARIPAAPGALLMVGRPTGPVSAYRPAPIRPDCRPKRKASPPATTRTPTPRTPPTTSLARAGPSTHTADASASAVAPSGATTVAAVRVVSPSPVAGSRMWLYRTPPSSTNCSVSPEVATP